MVPAEHETSMDIFKVSTTAAAALSIFLQSLNFQTEICKSFVAKFDFFLVQMFKMLNEVSM